MVSPIGQNFAAPGTMQSYTPTIIGATDNPVATYGTQIGQFVIFGGFCFYNILLTTTTMTKTTLTDVLRLVLPLTVGGATNSVFSAPGRIENTTAIANAVHAEALTGTAYLTFRAIPVTTASLPITYAVASPGIGVLTNTITFAATGFFAI